MLIHTQPLIIALAVAGALPVSHASGAAPVAVQVRVLKLPTMPAGAEVPVNLPVDGEVKLPYVTGGAPGVAPRINAAVWREMLDGAVAPTTPGPTYTPPPSKLPQGISTLEFASSFLPAAQPRLLALSFTGEGCGAYCEPFTSTKVFDLRDGREVSLGDILTVDGFAAAGRRVDVERRRAYSDEVRALRHDMKAAPKGKAGADNDDDQRLALNEDCLKQVSTQPSTPQMLLNYEFSLDGHGGLALKVGRCGNHAMGGLDDVGEISVAIAAAGLKGWLSSYGLAIVRQEGDAPPPASTFADRELHGRLGGLPITMKLEPLRDGAASPGWYAYDKYRTPVQLTVRKEGDALSAVEQTTAAGHFELTPAGGSLAGTWSDKARSKELPVILQ